MKLHGRLRRVSDIQDHERDEMFALLFRHFSNLDRATFDADLNEKQWAIEIVDPRSGRIHGFSTQTLLEQEFEGRRILAVFSGDTIVDPNHWGQNALAQVWAQFALSLIDANPDDELYWFLITNSFRTYRYLPVFFREFYPSCHGATPMRTAQLIDALAGSRYPTAYDRRRGIVNGHLWSGCWPGSAIAAITAERKRDPHIDFFAQRNAAYFLGDELCCIARLSEENITPAARRIVGPMRELLPAPQ